MATIRSASYAFRSRLRHSRQRMRRQRIARTSWMARTVSGFKSQPEPRSFGVESRGMQMAGGTFRYFGHMEEAPDTSPWDLSVDHPRFNHALHSFVWMEDLVAAENRVCRDLAKEWTHDWVTRYSNGTGAGWEPHLTGQRVLAWINHSVMLLQGQGKETQDAYFRSLARQARFLSKCWHHAAPGLDRFQALAGWAFCLLALEGRERQLPKLVRILGKECDARIAHDGGIVTRNPEELTEIFSLLAWVGQGISDAGLTPDKRHLLALERIAPSLRALRLGNGALARFHGGGAGLDGKLDQALSDSGVRLPPRVDGAMGFARMTSGGVTILADNDTVPAYDAAENAHASTLAFEMSSGLYPLIVNMGPGHSFGPDWRNGARATPSHSTLCVAGISSSRLTGLSTKGAHFGEKFDEIARVSKSEQDISPDGPRIIAEHEGYLATHGLIHRREMVLHRDGGQVSGFDLLESRRDSARRRFDDIADGKIKRWIAFGLHFHIHPDVVVELDMGGNAVSMTMPNGEVWVYRQEGGKLALKNSTYFDPLRVKPRATKQIVVSGRAINYEGAITWSLIRSQARNTG